ncbi:MAG: leucine-rich repeat protein [Pseudoruminococcus massiliensis]
MKIFNGFEYEVVKGNVIIENWCNSNSIIIPNEIDEKPVTVINAWGFAGSEVYSVKIPDSVIDLYGRAFKNCTKLSTIKVSKNLELIGFDCFSNTQLKSKPAIYKAFNITERGLVCRDYLFKENEWSEEIDEITPCESGYHYCTNLFEIFNYYSGALDKDIAIYICEVGDKIEKIDDSSKCVTNKIKPIKRLGREDIIRILNGGDV